MLVVKSRSHVYNIVRDTARNEGLEVVKAGVKREGRNLFKIRFQGFDLSKPQFIGYFHAVLIQDGNLSSRFNPY